MIPTWRATPIGSFTWPTDASRFRWWVLRRDGCAVNPRVAAALLVARALGRGWLRRPVRLIVAIAGGGGGVLLSTAVSADREPGNTTAPAPADRRAHERRGCGDPSCARRHLRRTRQQDRGKGGGLGVVGRGDRQYDVALRRSQLRAGDRPRSRHGAGIDARIEARKTAADTGAHRSLPVAQLGSGTRRACERSS